MTKTIVCPECHGFGHINRECENSTWSVLCDYCNGRGVLRVPMTNADRIRDMSDEELAEFLGRIKEPCDYCQLVVTTGACTETLCDDAMMKWLQQSVED